ncbi:hypothetical protein ACOSQ3_007983 [Xanthoceras sorbifolium]
MISVSSANHEAASNSHGEIITSLGCCSSNIDDQDVKMKEEDYTYMDPLLYRAAADGNFQPFDVIEKEMSLIITPDKNTILHIHIRSQAIQSTTTSFMEKLVAKCPSLWLQVNAIGDTPLHVAAKYGNILAVQFLIDSVKVENDQRVLSDDDIKQMLRKTNNAGNTPLHEAVQHDFYEVVIILSKEDPDFLYPVNNLDETPLYLAVEKGYHMVDEILKGCKKLAYEGPHGRTALHAAAKESYNNAREGD